MYKIANNFPCNDSSISSHDTRTDSENGQKPLLHVNFIRPLQASIVQCVKTLCHLQCVAAKFVYVCM